MASMYRNTDRYIINGIFGSAVQIHPPTKPPIVSPSQRTQWWASLAPSVAITEGNILWLLKAVTSRPPNRREGTIAFLYFTRIGFPDKTRSCQGCESIPPSDFPPIFRLIFHPLSTSWSFRHPPFGSVFVWTNFLRVAVNAR